MRDRDRYFRTTSLPLAVYLYTKNQQVTGINPTDGSGKKEFSFARSDYLDELVEKYKFGSQEDPDLLVSVHAYEYARNTLLDRLNE